MGKYTWDEPLPADIIKKWAAISTDLEQAVQLTTNRRYFQSKENIQILHIFVDASQKAFGAAAYLTDGSTAALVAAKTRVASLEKRTLPQRELEAAELGTKLAETILTALSSSITAPLQVEMWSDSQDVLYWLVSKKKLPVFVSNRVNIINTFNKKYHATWHYCPTADNPADLVTRGITPDKLFSSSSWISGPSWIMQEESWPKWSPRSSVTTMAIIAAPADKVELPSPDISIIMNHNRFGTLSRLLRTTAWINRFIQLTRLPHQKDSTLSLSAKEVLTSLHIWIKSIQKKAFPVEMTYLNSNQLGKRPPLVRQLDLYLQNGIIHCGGRMKNAEMDKQAKNPILLPKSDYFTTLIIRVIHQRIQHGGVSATVAALRQTYWIPSARQQVRAILRQCVRCKIINGLPYASPDPAPLPKERVWNMEPFTGTGVDLTGALTVKSEADHSINIKVYIALFTCTSSRAVHLEVVEDLSADKFLDALRRFSNRKSTPRIIFSDNATNFQSSAAIIRKLMESQSVSDFCSGRGIEWRFIVKRAPWHGGFWERLIGLTKSTLKKVIGKNRITEGQLRTIITDVEAALNDRPLTYVSTEKSDSEPITPSHLLFGRRIIPFPMDNPPEWDEDEDPTFTLTTTNLVATAQLKSKVIHDFMARWKHEYLSALREFQQHTSGKNRDVIQPGDVVIVHDDNKPRLSWNLAVVESLIRGESGNVYSANIRTSQGKTNRPIRKLYPLEVRAAQEPIDESPSPPSECVAGNQQPESSPEQPESSPEPTTDLNPARRSTRRAAANAKGRIAAWAALLQPQ